MRPAIVISKTRSSPLAQLLQLPLLRKLPRTTTTATAASVRRLRIPRLLLATSTTTTDLVVPAELKLLSLQPPRPTPAIANYRHTRTTTFSTSAAAMSEMPATSGHSAACCNIPPIVTKGYEGKGSYEELGGLNTYVTGPTDATKAILVIYDIFGYFHQTIQGADLLATSGKEGYRVLIPDWFEGSPADISWYPPTTEDHKKNLGAFFQKYPPPKVAGQVAPYVKAAQEKYPGIKSWAVLGYCWGGKIVSIVTASEDNPFSAGAEIHPAMIDPADAKGIKVPLCLLASKDEDADDVKKFSDNLTVEKYVETFPDQIHGWMAARADLEDKKVEAEYRRGYEAVLKFFGKVL